MNILTQICDPYYSRKTSDSKGRFEVVFLFVCLFSQKADVPILTTYLKQSKLSTVRGQGQLGVRKCVASCILDDLDKTETAVMPNAL